MSAAALQVFVLRGGALVTSEVFPEGVHVIGRDPGCDLVLDDPAVWPEHARLQFAGGQVLLTSEAGAGIIVNGDRVREARVRSADDVAVGPFTLKIRALARRAPAAKAESARAPAKDPPRSAPAPLRNAPVGTPVLGPAPSAEEIDAIFDAALAQAADTIPSPAPLPMPAARAAPAPPPPPAAPPPPAPGPALEAEVLEVEVAPDDEPEEIEIELADEDLFDPEPAAPAAAPPSSAMPPPAPATPPPQARPRPAGSVRPSFARLPPPVLTPVQPPAASPRPIEAQAIAPAQPPRPAPTPMAPPPELEQPMDGRAPVTAPQAIGRVALRGVAAGSMPLVEAITPLSSPRARSATPPVLTPALPAALVDVDEPVLHARVLWHDAVLSARTFPARALLETGQDEAAVLPAYGFPTTPRLAVREDGGWRIQPPPGVSVLERLASGAWRPAALDAKGGLRLLPGRALRLMSEHVHVELLAQPPAARAGAGLRRLLDVRGLCIVLGLCAALGAFLRLVPAPPSPLAVRPPAPPARLVRARLPQPRPDVAAAAPSRPATPRTRGAMAYGGTSPQRAGELRVSVASRPQRVQGDIDRDQVAEVMKAHLDQMRSCSGQALLAKAPPPAGKVGLRWTIAPDGSVAEAAARRPTLRSPEVVSCLLELMRGMRFPKPTAGSATVTWLVRFDPPRD